MTVIKIFVIFFTWSNLVKNTAKHNTPYTLFSCPPETNIVSRCFSNGDIQYSDSGPRGKLPILLHLPGNSSSPQTPVTPVCIQSQHQQLEAAC